MFISTNSQNSNASMLGHEAESHEKAKSLGKVFILKIKELNSVPLSIREYENVSKSLEQIKSNGFAEIVTVNESLRKQMGIA